MFGHGEHASQNAIDVARAFFGGRSLKRSNCHTDGQSYWLYNNEIARRLLVDYPVEQYVAAKLLGEYLSPPFQFRFAGWPTKTTCRHLDALGLRASISQSTPRINNHVVDIDEWYTPATLDACPVETDGEAELRRRRERRAEKKRWELAQERRRVCA